METKTAVAGLMLVGAGMAWLAALPPRSGAG
jgi:hypothetical protein